MDALIGTFHIDWKLMLAQIVNFAIVFFVLYKFVIKPLGKVLSERKELIQKGIEDGEKNSALLKEAQLVHDKELAQARLEGHALITEIKKTAEEKKEEMLEQTNLEIQKMLSDSKKSIEEEKTKMLSDVQKEIASLVMLATEKVIGDNLSDTINQGVVNKSIESMKK